MHFRRAELWEVGTYLLVQHQTDQPICNALNFQMKYLETFEEMRDEAEIESLALALASATHRESASPAASAPPRESALAESTTDDTGADDETGGDTAFLIALMPFGVKKRAILTSTTAYKTSLMAMTNVKLIMLMKTSMGFDHICLNNV